MNLPLESWHNQFAAIRVIDQTVGSFLGFLGARNTMVQLVFCYKYVCVEFYANIGLFCNIVTTILCSLCKKRPSTCKLHQGEHFCPCSFQYYHAKSQQICTTNSSSLSDAPFWQLSRSCTLREKQSYKQL